MNVVTVDTHVHTCLSPCGALDMHPGAVARAAAAAGVDGVVVCDHNAADNVAAVQRAARAAGRAAVAGLEITSEEEVHVVAVLPDASTAEDLQARVAAALPPWSGPLVFGQQIIANERAEVLGVNRALLAGATRWSIERTIDEVHRAGGWAIAAHIDRRRFGLVGQLGFVPPGLALDAVEVSPRTSYDDGRARFGSPLGVPVVAGSDAHDPADVGRAVTFFWLDRFDGHELGLALRGGGGRAVLGGGRPLEDLAMHILDIAQNAIEAGATRIAIGVSEDPVADTLTLTVDDNGPGMTGVTAARARDPFFTTRQTRAVGLGLPLLEQAAEAAGGGLELRSRPGEGTVVRARFQYSHVDRAPLGDLETTVVVLASARPDVDIDFTHRRGARDYSFTTADIRRVIGGQALSHPEGLALLRAAIRAGETCLAGADERTRS